MRRTVLALLWLLAGALAASASAATTPAVLTGDAALGREVFKGCEGCHSVQPNVHLFGPSLAGVVGRPAGRLKGYAFSDALSAQKFTWTNQRLEAWLGDEPKNLVPGTRMEFPGIADKAQLHQLIAYLDTLKR